MRNEDLNDLANVLNAETPVPDASEKVENLALAMKNFDALQGSTPATRQTSDSSKRTGYRGVIEMMRNWKTWGTLGASTAVAAIVGITYFPAGNLERATSDAQIAPASAPIPMVDFEQASPEIEPATAEEIVKLDSAFVPNQAATSLKRSVSAPLVKSLPSSDTRPGPRAEENTETFAKVDENPVKVTAENPVSTFSVDVDTTSWSVIRNSLSDWGSLPNKDAVRIEEMVNYFPYDYPSPEGDLPFSVQYQVAAAPWNAGKQLITIGLQGAKPAARVPLNLVFLIDTSGSMNDPKKLPLLKQSFRLLLGQLSPEDEISIVTYAGSAGQVLEPTKASERDTILNALENLSAGGGTAGQEGLQQAYSVAESMASEGEITRVLLATDGDFNVGISDPEALEDFIAKKRDLGVYLSVLGFGRGYLNDATMQALAQNGNGFATYIDTLGEAQKVLVDQMQGALFPIADDVKIQVEFNPAKIAEYRLLGYETRALRREDFNNDQVDAGEIGPGHQVTAIYEVTPVGSPARLTDPLRYESETVANTSDELGFLRLRYKNPGEETSELIETPLNASDGTAGFAAAIAGFGELLRGSDLLGNWSYADAITLAQENRGDDPYGYRQEAIQLMRLAESLSR